MNNIERVIIFGCSYASGEELLYNELDSKLLYIRENSKDPRDFFNAIEQNKKYQDQYDDIIKRQYNLAWPKKLATLLGAECVNFAESGNSMQRMLWQFLKYKDQFTSNDLIIFSQTKPDRNVFFKDKPMSFQVSSILNSSGKSLIGVGKNGNAATVVDENFDSVIVNWFTDDRIMWDNLMVLMSLGYFKKFYNIRIAPSMSFKGYELKSYNQDMFSNTADLLLSELLIGNKSMDDLKGANEDLLWGHPALEVHDKFARHLYKELTSV